MSPILKLHKDDNVAIALTHLPAQTHLQLENTVFKTNEAIEAMHKVALRNIAQGEILVKYGQAIGVATRAIAMGSHIHTHNCGMDGGERDYGFCRHACPTDFIPEQSRATFEGFKRANGKVGTRNYIGIITTVNCSATVAGQLASHFNYSGALNDYPNVDGVVALGHDSGCGMRADGEGFDLLHRTLTGYANHANFGAIVVIGLGCETMQVSTFLEDSGLQPGELCHAFTIQESGGTRAAIERGIKTIKGMLPKVNENARSTVPASELVLALQCGGSDAFSGITANPALGAAGDLLVRHGGTIIYSETPEIFGAEHLLTQRAESSAVAEQILERIRWWQSYTARHGFELNNNPSPGNKSGGLTTITEKSLGAQSKSGSTALRAVYQYAEPVIVKGLVFMDSPGFDPVSVTGQVASGANLICFTTGRGSAFGFKPVPSIKLASNNVLFESMREDIDVNCGEIIGGTLSVEACGAIIFERILAVASGAQTQSESLGYGDNEFNPWRLGATV